MALITCTACSGKVSDAARACPHCGHILLDEGAHHDALSMVMLLTPVGAVLLMWFWIGEMALIQGPGSHLEMVAILTLIATAGMAAYEASRTGMARGDGKGNRSPLDWGLWLALGWVYGFPSYFKRRELYGKRSLFKPAIAITAVFLLSVLLVGNAIDNQAAEVQGQFQQLERQFQQLGN